MLVERQRELLLPEPPYRAETQTDIARPEAIRIGQEFPRRSQQRPFGRAGKKTGATHLKSQRPRCLLQQCIQMPAVTIEPIMEIAPESQDPGRSVRRIEQLTIAA